MNDDIDILMITYNRAAYTKLALSRLLETCDERMRVWVWQNGNDEETVSVVRSFLNHPRLHRFNHSHENKKLNEPTNWLWENAKGTFFTKVDDDCLMPLGWADTLRAAHLNNPQFGVIGCWRFPTEDFIPEIAHRKIKTFTNGHQLMVNCWVEGSGYLMKRRCVEQAGPLKAKQSFTAYCIQLSSNGWMNGWYFPFLYQEHMDDPRSEHSLLRSDEDMEEWAPLSALNNGVRTVDAWQAQLRRSAELLQRASPDPRRYVGWRRGIKRLWGSAKRLVRVRRQW